jgi:hypothetical protein
LEGEKKVRSRKKAKRRVARKGLTPPSSLSLPSFDFNRVDDRCFSEQLLNNHHTQVHTLVFLASQLCVTHDSPTNRSQDRLSLRVHSAFFVLVMVISFPRSLIAGCITRGRSHGNTRLLCLQVGFACTCFASLNVHSHHKSCLSVAFQRACEIRCSMAFVMMMMI